MPDGPRITRLGGETEPAWAAFLLYAEQGPGRTQAIVAAKVGTGRAAIKRVSGWAKKWRWRERADQWDAAEIEAGRAKRAKFRERAYQTLYDCAEEAAEIVVKLARGDDVGTHGKPSVQLQAAIHALAQAGMVPPKRTELIVEQDDGLGAAREAMSALTLAQLEAILSLEEPEDGTG